MFCDGNRVDRVNICKLPDGGNDILKHLSGKACQLEFFYSYNILLFLYIFSLEISVKHKYLPAESSSQSQDRQGVYSCFHS